MMKLADMPSCLEGGESGINRNIIGLTTNLTCIMANRPVEVRLLLLQLRKSKSS